METCKALHEYSWLVNEIRQSPSSNLETAIDKVIEKMPRDFVIRNFIMGHRAEVKGMFLTEWDQEEALAQERIEGREEGREEGRKEGREEGLEEGREEGKQFAKRSIYERLVADGMPAQKASIITGWNMNSTVFGE